MANQQRGEVTLKLCGMDYTLRPTFESLCELEDRTNSSVLQTIASMRGGDIRLKELTHIIWSGMFGYDAENTPEVEVIGKLIIEEGLTNVMQQEDSEGTNVVLNFLVNGILGGEEVDETSTAKKPVRKKKRKR